MIRKEMRESPAWRAAPDNLRRLLDRLEVEHMRHAGTQNGKLAVTYDDFAEWGVRRASVALTIRQGLALGFLEVTRKGYKSAAEFRVPSLYRLTYVWGRKPGSREAEEPTDEWRRLDEDGAANALREAATSRDIDRRRAGASGEPATSGALPRLGYSRT
ncbi:hypothetical protein ACFODL_08885 [Phenylobacterium terrae]|uniref:Uncharacterized protein n=1 Tax=Phenylobacterium terrae TaxID=2665495 RepID=A0ABW4N4Q0_9CAUL